MRTTDLEDEFSAENLAVVGDMAVMITAANALYDELQMDLTYQKRLIPSQRRSIVLKLLTLNKQLLRGAEFLKDRLEEEVFTSEERTRWYFCRGDKMSLAESLGTAKQEITSQFYTETAFNLNPEQRQ